ncbi:MAG: response regulator, partial [Anaerolineae bacterium]|nr:response regulator [Anaerolineae bacterium]
AETREQLRKLLSFDPEIDVVAMVASGEEAVAAMPDAFPDVILMDINLPGMDGIAATGKVIEINPAVQVIMLSVQGESDYMRRAMMAGARDYLAKPPGADELLDAIHRAYELYQRMGPVTGGAAARRSESAASKPGAALEAKIITVYSPKGGTGCTSLAVNMAIAMQEMLGSDSKVCLVDANLQFGDVAIFMKLQATRSLADLAPHVNDLDSDLFKSILITHSSGISVLVAPPTPEDAEVFRNEALDDSGVNTQLKMILEFARHQFDYIIIDTAHQVDNVILTAIDLTDLLLVITRPVIPEIRGARLFMDLLHKLDYGMDKVALVINSVDNKRMGIQPAAIEKAMMPALIHLPLDERTALRAANLGEPVMQKNSRTPLGQGYIELAQKIQGYFTKSDIVKDEPNPTDVQKRAGLGRLL